MNVEGGEEMIERMGEEKKKMGDSWALLWIMSSMVLGHVLGQIYLRIGWDHCDEQFERGDRCTYFLFHPQR